MGEVTRRLPVILPADVAGYSGLLGADEAETLGRLRAMQRDVLDLLHGGGRIVAALRPGHDRIHFTWMKQPDAVDAITRELEALLLLP